MDNLKIGFSPEGNFKYKLTDKTYNGLKCYEIIDGKITIISFVGSPAHGVLAKGVLSERKIMGPVLIPNVMIYRINPITGEEFYIYFTEEVINKIYTKYKFENWAEEEQNNLFNLYISGKTIEEIEVILKKPKKYIEEKLKSSNKLDLDVVRMSGLKMNIKDICNELNISIDEFYDIIYKLGGSITKH